MAKKRKNVSIAARNPQELAKTLGLPSSAAIEWELRRKIAEQIAHKIEEDNLSMTEIAEKAGTSRARVSNIVNNHAIGISLDVLVRVLWATGQKIEIRFLNAS